MSVENERKRVIKLREDLSKLKIEYSKKEAKIAPLQKKIIAANSAISRTKNNATIKSKLNEIERSNKQIADISKKCGDLQKKIGAKEKELSAAEKKLSEAEVKEAKRVERETTRRFNSVDETLNLHASVQESLYDEIQELKKIPEEITILFLASNPVEGCFLKLDEEARSIQEKIRLSEYRDTVRFETRWAVRAGDIMQAINETNPTIIHFSGHGCEDGELVLQNPDGTPKLVSPQAVSQAISTVSDTVKLVFFNACYSSVQAARIAENIDTAIGMNSPIGDEAARVFAARFYSSVGFGLSVAQSFKQAKAELLLEGIPEDTTPELFEREGVSADALYLVAKN